MNVHAELIKYVLGATFAALTAFPGSAGAEMVKGHLVDLSSVDSTVTVALDNAKSGAPPATYRVARDARWNICFTDVCVDKIGVAGFRTVNDYAEFGAYGIPRESYEMIMNVNDRIVTQQSVEIVPDLH